SATLCRVKKPVSMVTSALRVDGRASRWTEHRVTRRVELIDAAIVAVKRHGTDVGMDQIAAIARTSKPVIYRYFTDKNDLYRAVGQRVIARVVEALAAIPHDSEPQTLMRASID